MNGKTENELFDSEIHEQSKGAKKKGFFKKLVSAFKRVIFPVAVDEETVNISTGSFDYLSMDDLSRSYDDVRRASLLCEKALKIAGTRADLAAKLQTIKDKLKELEKFELMPEEEKKYITNILERYKDVSHEKQSLRGQISTFNKILDYLEPLENEVESSITQMDEAEDMQRRIKLDMNYIEGERADLEFQKEEIEQNLVIIYRVAIGVTVFFSIVTVGLLYLYIERGIEIFVWALYCVIAVIVLATILYIFRRRLIFEDKLNVMLQIRAVELLNKKKVLYVYYTSFLDYEYKKYRVQSAFELRDIWREYSYYKHVTSRYGNIRNLSYTIEDELQAFLKKNGLHNSKTSIEGFSKILDFESNKKEYMRFNSQRTLTEAKLQKLEDEQKNVWSELLILKERDVTKDGIIERMMNEYFEDVSKVLPMSDEEDSFNYSY